MMGCGVGGQVFAVPCRLFCSVCNVGWAPMAMVASSSLADWSCCWGQLGGSKVDTSIGQLGSIASPKAISAEPCEASLQCKVGRHLRASQVGRSARILTLFAYSHRHSRMEARDLCRAPARRSTCTLVQASAATLLPCGCGLK
jgi:hypothetical protein